MTKISRPSGRPHSLATYGRDAHRVPFPELDDLVVELQHDYGLGPLRVRGMARVQLQADLTILARLALESHRAGTRGVTRSCSPLRPRMEGR
jgi:hypothetical protein